MAVTPQQLDDLFSDMDDHVSDFKGWGQRTRNQRNHWVKVMLEKVNEVIVDTCFPLELVCWNDALKIFGGARILEEFWTEEEDTSTYKTSLDAMQYFMDDFDLDPRTLSEWKQLAMRCALSNSLLVESIGFHNYIILLDPIDAQARLNLAGARLRVANDADHRFQWSRAINDCTLALYYGPPTFKAYYRRGFALAHLKIWDKAILDYEKALRIEPTNVLVKMLLESARAKRPI